jgi:methylene-fatty-acyl-phospholipid synthase
VWASRTHGMCLSPAAVQLTPFLLGLLLLAFGQSLNVGVYQALGEKGTYYGFKLGATVPWVHGFPFNVVPHPQYVGSVLSVWGLLTAFQNQLPPQALVVAAYWSALYVLTGIQEAHF